jgi:acyl carrier protein
MHNLDVGKLVHDAVIELNKTLETEERLTFSEDTLLFAEGASVDSLSLVSLIMDIEEEVGGRGFDVSLTSNESMETMDEPFKTLGNLIKYIELLVSK